MVEDLGVEVEEMEEEAAAMEVVSRILVGAATIGDGRGGDDVRRHWSVSEECVCLMSLEKAPGSSLNF